MSDALGYLHLREASGPKDMSSEGATGRKKVSLKKVKGGENVCPYSDHCHRNRGSFILAACLQDLVGLTPLPGSDICRPFLPLLVIQEERGEGGRGREELRQWWAPWLHESSAGILKNASLWLQPSVFWCESAPRAGLCEGKQ